MAQICVPLPLRRTCTAGSLSTASRCQRDEVVSRAGAQRHPGAVRVGAYLAVGVEVGGGDLQGDAVLRLLVQLLSDEPGLLHQQVGPHDLLPQLPQAARQHALPGGRGEQGPQRTDRGVQPNARRQRDRKMAVQIPFKDTNVITALRNIPLSSNVS